MSYETLSPKQVALLRQHRDELLEAKRQTEERLAEIEAKLVASNLDITSHLKGSFWTFEGHTDNKTVAASTATNCRAFSLPPTRPDFGGTRNELPREVMNALRKNRRIELGAYGGYTNIVLQEHDNLITLRFDHGTEGEPLAVAKELGLRLSFTDYHDSALFDLERANKRISLVEDVERRAANLLGEENVFRGTP
jgi:hypothetical protein